MSYLLFAFGWAYALGQLPSGGLLDRFGSKRVYGIAIIGWSVCAFLTAFAGYFAASAAFTAIFILRVFSGLFQSPVFPGNGRIVASWFPTSERGRASAIFNSAQYFALPIFAPIFGWLIHVVRLARLLLVPGRARLRARRRLVHKHLRRQRTSQHFAVGDRSHRTRRRPGQYRLRRRREEEHAHLGHGQEAPELSHAGRRLHRPVLHHHAHLVFSHLVPALSFAGAPHVGAQGRLRGGRAGPLRRHRRHPWRHLLRSLAAQRPFAQLRAQASHHGRHGAVHDHHRLQLRVARRAS